MKFLSRLLFLCLLGLGNVYAQSNLPACQGRDAAKWRDCYGTFAFTDGGKYIGEFKDGKFNGQGTFYSSDGSSAMKATLAQGSLMTSDLTVRITLLSTSSQKIELPDWFPSDLIFDKDEQSLTLDSLSDIKKVIVFLLENKFVRLAIIGTGYNFGGREINLSIGQRLASQVVALLEQGGIDKNRMEAISSGREKISSQRFMQEKVPNQTVAVAEVQQKIPVNNQPDCQGVDSNRSSNCFITLTFAAGDNYVGEYKDGKPHGVGTFTSANGDKYVGQFKDGKSNGQGTYTHSNGDKYVGEYRDSKPNGQGTLYAPNGSITRRGNWANGNFVSTVPVQHASAVNQMVASPTAQPENYERAKLLAEVEAERKKRQELEEQLKVAQQPNQPGKPTVSSVNERRVALVIGNATYKVNPLKNPVNDSTDMARSLRSVGFDVIEANNTTLAQMREVTRRFADKLGSSDVGLVYYSGHGVEVKGKNYLIPVNADIKREYEVVDQAFDASQFLEMMDNIRGPNNKRVNILIVDACRNNELQKSWRSTNNGLARMDAPGGTFISFATAPGRVAADGVGRNSPYTKHLLQALKQPNVPIEQVFKVVRRNVMEETKGEQIPWENSSLVGDFYFTVQR